MKAADWPYTSWPERRVHEDRRIAHESKGEVGAVGLRPRSLQAAAAEGWRDDRL
jgi:hypothetical protein